MVDYTKQEKVALLRDFLNVVGTETEGVEVKITQDADNGMRFYSEPQVLIDVKNDSGAQIDKGTPVYVSGEHGGSGKPTIEKAKADAAATMPAIGLVLTDLADQAEGYVLAAGTLLNLDTDTPGFDAGDALYVSPTTAGDLTKTRPTGDTQLVQKVALVARRHATAGSVIVMGAGRTNDTPNDSYSGRYNTEAETQRSGATATTEIYYTARPDGDGYAESEVDDSGVPVGDTVVREIYFHDEFDADPDGAGWTAYTTQPSFNETFANAKAALLAGLNDTDGTANTRGTLPLSLKMERAVVTNLLLDDYPGAKAAYSLRKIDRNYTGDAIRIREDGGNTETDIGFTTGGDLDTAAIASHCGANNGYVTTFYDQSGNSNDATQATTGNQPQIYNGTSVITDNGKPCLYFPTSQLLSAGAVATVGNRSRSQWSVFSLEAGTDYAAPWARGLRSQISPPDTDLRPNLYVNRTGGTPSITAASGLNLNQQYLRCDIADTVTAESFIDGSSVLSSSDNNSDWSTSELAIAQGGNRGPFKVTECILYESDQSSNRSGIESNINAYFSIY